VHTLRDDYRGRKEKEISFPIIVQDSGKPRLNGTYVVTGDAVVYFFYLFLSLSATSGQQGMLDNIRLLWPYCFFLISIHIETNSPHRVSASG